MAPPELLTLFLSFWGEEKAATIQLEDEFYHVSSKLATYQL